MFAFVLCSFAQGSNGIYFGMKDFLLSELSGKFSISADTVTSKDGERCAQLRMRVGCAPVAPMKYVPASPVVAHMC